MAEAGDTVGKLAGRAFGSNTRAGRDALVAANPTLKAGRVVAGRSYAVPAASVATAEPVPAAKPGRQAGRRRPVHPFGTATRSGRSPRTRVGSPHAVAAIRDLNRDVLHGDHLRTHMRLRLPKHAAATD